MPIPTQFYRDIERAVQKGLSLDQIEAVVLRPMQLGGDLMAALWLYAWGLRERASRADDASDRRYGSGRQDEA